MSGVTAEKSFGGRRRACEAIRRPTDPLIAAEAIAAPRGDRGNNSGRDAIRRQVSRPARPALNHCAKAAQRTVVFAAGRGLRRGGARGPAGRDAKPFEVGGYLAAALVSNGGVRPEWFKEICSWPDADLRFSAHIWG